MGTCGLCKVYTYLVGARVLATNAIVTEGLGGVEIEHKYQVPSLTYYQLVTLILYRKSLVCIALLSILCHHHCLDAALLLLCCLVVLLLLVQLCLSKSCCSKCNVLQKRVSLTACMLFLC